MKRGKPGVRAAALVMLVLCPVADALAEGRAPLRPYNVDPGTVSVSGLSSGANMAIQLGVAHASRIAGVGAFSAVPYDCLRPGNVTRNSCLTDQVPNIEPLAANMRLWSGREIDDTAALARQRVYVFVGRHDVTYGRTVVDQTANLYSRFVAPENLRYETSVDVGNMIPADFDNPYSSLGWTCSNTRALVANCGFDGAGEMLRWIYGDLVPRNATLPATGYTFVDQSEFGRREDGLDDTAILYVPPPCESGVACKLHIHLHACRYTFFDRGDDVVARWTGFTRWAETNNIVVLFPQVYPDPVLNDNGCWDDDGRYGAEFDQKGGAQIRAVMAMVARITSGYAAQKAIEYRHAGFGHYYVTTEVDEIAKLDAGVFAGWERTGYEFAVQSVGAAGATAVCRFVGAFGTTSSHFYALEGPDCETVKQNPDWQFEGLRFAVYAAGTGGTCATGTRPVFRLYNNGQGGAPNHRYTTDPTIRSQMIAAGWVAEGAGDGVIGCVPQ